MTAPVLADALGPRGRRQARIATIVSLVAIAGLLVAAFRRLEAKGQFDGDLWEPLTRWAAIKFLLEGLRNNIQAAAVAMALALLIGAAMALARSSRSRTMRLPAVLYVEFFRGVPVYLLIFYCAFGLPQSGISITPFHALILGLALYNGAIIGEIFRAGILSLDRGQSEAAYAVGMGYWQAMLLVVVPQAFRRMIPALISQLVTLFKDTSLGYVITYEELVRRSEISGTYFQNPLQFYLIAALMFIVICYALSRLVQRLEVRQRRRYGGDIKGVTGVDDLAVVTAQNAPAQIVGV